MENDDARGFERDEASANRCAHVHSSARRSRTISSPKKPAAAVHPITTRSIERKHHTHTSTALDCSSSLTRFPKDRILECNLGLQVGRSSAALFGSSQFTVCSSRRSHHASRLFFIAVAGTHPSLAQTRLLDPWRSEFSFSKTGVRRPKVFFWGGGGGGGGGGRVEAFRRFLLKKSPRQNVSVFSGLLLFRWEVLAAQPTTWKNLSKWSRRTPTTSGGTFTRLAQSSSWGSAVRCGASLHELWRKPEML